MSRPKRRAGHAYYNTACTLSRTEFDRNLTCCYEKGYESCYDISSLRGSNIHSEENVDEKIA